MADAKEYSKTTEVKTETRQDSDGALNSEYSEETTVRTEHTVEKEKEKEREPIVIIEERR